MSLNFSAARENEWRLLISAGTYIFESTERVECAPLNRDATRPRYPIGSATRFLAFVSDFPTLFVRTTTNHGHNSSARTHSVIYSVQFRKYPAVSFVNERSFESRTTVRIDRATFTTTSRILYLAELVNKTRSRERTFSLRSSRFDTNLYKFRGKIEEQERVTRGGEEGVERLEKFECWSQQLRSEKVRQNAENVGRVNEQPGRRRRQNNSAGNAPALTLFIGRPNVAGENLAGRGVPWTAYQSLRRCL